MVPIISLYTTNSNYKKNLNNLMNEIKIDKKSLYDKNEAEFSFSLTQKK